MGNGCRQIPLVPGLIPLDPGELLEWRGDPMLRPLQQRAVPAHWRE